MKSISGKLRMPIENRDSIESDKDYNYYLFEYQPVTEYLTEDILSKIKLETALISYSFPAEEQEVSSIIYESLYNDMPELKTQYGLAPFRMQVQSVSRTFIDKIYPVITFDDTFKELICQVREHRSYLSNCPSAKQDINIKTLI